MCWTSYNKPVKLIAEKDVPVFKVAKIANYGKTILPYFFSTSDWYTENTVYLEPGITLNTKISGASKPYTISKGLHSYSVENIRLQDYYHIDKVIKFIPLVRITTHKTTPMSQDVIVTGQTYQISNVAIMLCTIPKGATYYVNEVGEIVSDKLEVKRIIRNPFKTNKDNKTSIRSVDKVNVILNKWEKGILYV